MRKPPAALALILAPLFAIAPARADTEPSGFWTYTYEPSSDGKSGLVTALSPAPGADLYDPSQLVARCFGGRTEFMVGGAGGWGLPRTSLEVTTQIGSESPETGRWDVSTNGKAVFLAENVEAFLKRLPDDGKVRVAVKDATGTLRENIFATTGFGKVRAKIAEACAWGK